MATAKQNQNAHKAARVASILWNERYAAQRGGMMDFWEKLRPVEQQVCREIVEQLLKAPPEAA